jgi:hypothetical protein
MQGLLIDRKEITARTTQSISIDYDDMTNDVITTLMEEIQCQLSA